MPMSCRKHGSPAPMLRIVVRPHHFFQDSLPCLMLGPKFLLRGRFFQVALGGIRTYLDYDYDGKGRYNCSITQKIQACLLLTTSNEQYCRSEFKQTLDVFIVFCSPASTSHGPDIAIQDLLVVSLGPRLCTHSTPARPHKGLDVNDLQQPT